MHKLTAAIKHPFLGVFYPELVVSLRKITQSLWVNLIKLSKTLRERERDTDTHREAGVKAHNGAHGD